VSGPFSLGMSGMSDQEGKGKFLRQLCGHDRRILWRKKDRKMPDKNEAARGDSDR
jgi:predicted secreted protein